MLKEDSVSKFSKEEIFECLLKYFNEEDISEISEIKKESKHGVLRKRFFILKVKNYPKMHVSLGINLQETFEKTKLVFETFPKFSCKPVFIVGNKQFQLFGQEFFDGDSIDHCLQTGTHSVEDILSILIDLEKELTKKEEVSSQDNLMAEIFDFEKKILCLDILTPIDKYLLHNYFFPIFKKKLNHIRLVYRLTPGDLAARNILVNQEGNYRIIDCEFAYKTHFYDVDWIRLSHFSNPQINSLDFLNNKLKAIDPIVHSYFHFQQLILNEKVHTKDKLQSFAHFDISELILNLSKQILKSEESIFLKSIFENQKSLEINLRDKSLMLLSIEDSLAKEKKEKEIIESQFFKNQSIKDAKELEILNKNKLIDKLSNDFKIQKEVIKIKESELKSERQERIAKESELESERQKRIAKQSELESERQKRIAKQSELESERQKRLVKESELESERQKRLAKETELKSERQERIAKECELTKEIEIKLDKIQRVEKSFSWRVTSPLRFLRRFALDPIKNIRKSSNSFSSLNTSDYSNWVKYRDTFGEKEEKAYKRLYKNLNTKPLISILMPVYNTPEKFLRIAIESVINQIYLEWELCIADDGSTHPIVREVLEEYSRKDARIKISFRDTSGHISEASNTAANLASGDFIAMLDHDDKLREHSLLLIVKTIEENEDVALLYSDEDKIDERDQRFSPFFKPCWNPDLLRSQNYICHLLVVRSSEFFRHKGFRIGFEGSQDWDLLLRLTEELNPNEIVHIPKILYHWRATKNSTALSVSNKDYSTKSSLKTLHEHYNRTNSSFSPIVLSNGYFGSISSQKDLPSVSIIIPTRNGGKVLSRCINSIVDKTNYDNYEIVIIDNNSDDAETLNLFKDFKSKILNLKISTDTSPFNFSALNNKVAKSINSRVLVFLNDDTEILENAWLSELAIHSIRKEIGAVGGKLLYPNGTIQHAGVILGIGGVAGHAFRTFPEDYSGQMNRANLIHNVSAVTGACLAIENRKFQIVGGFDDKKLAVAFNDVDICLKLLKKGFRNLYLPQVKLLHHESYTRGMEDNPVKQARFRRETETMLERWKDILKNDPCYNPNLTLSDEQFTIKN